MDVDDLLAEIFVRLPSESVQRFITTCKQWQSLITNPTFRKLWRKRNRKPATGLFVLCWTSGSTYFVPFSLNIPTRSLPYLRNGLRTIIQSCNGLLLCSSATATEYLAYHVYNPTTNTCHTLPDVYKFTGLGNRIVSLAFDPNKSPHYKVICCMEGYPTHVQVYSSDTPYLWKFVSVSNYPTYYVAGRPVYWNGAILYLTSCTYFDIENEKFKRRPAPPYRWETTCCYYFGESYGRFNYACLCKSSSSYVVYMYELKRDYSEWILKYHVELDDDMYSILSVVHGVEDEDSFLILRNWKRIVRYNLVSMTFEELLNTKTVGCVDENAFQYIESLCGV